MKQLSKSIFYLALAFTSCFSKVSAEVPFPYAPGGALVDIDTFEEEEKKPIALYELIDENFRPEADEFYLSTIYGPSDDPRALIKRSNNMRSGDLYTGAVEYKIGDKISDEYKIYAIDFRNREVIVQNIDSHEFFALKLSYGSAKSKLIKKYDYEPQ